MRRLWMIALLGAGLGYWLYRNREQPPEWPSRKKLRKDARRAEAARRAHQAPVRPPEVHVEKEASPVLKVPLGDLTR